ncbi:hypothetical protein [Albibacterium indicum]|uniref:hypothetical protein n=1 Tax=Albibacterium indicum TaxID=2292082 RepID=UPI0013007BEE|nr:hypothetical protein [Pedobacter indicus]
MPPTLLLESHPDVGVPPCDTNNQHSTGRLPLGGGKHAPRQSQHHPNYRRGRELLSINPFYHTTALSGEQKDQEPGYFLEVNR